MKTTRRQFMQQTSLGLGALGLLTPTALAAAAARSPSFLVRAPQMKLGFVTYNIAKDWDLETIIRNGEAARYDGVELRTTHKHGVEVTLSPQERQRVKQRFANSKLELASLGSAFDFHTPDPAKLQKDIAATKEYIKLAHDVGAPAVKVRPNALPKEVPVQRTLEQIGRALRELGSFGEDLGVQIRLEVHGSGTSALPHIRTIMDVADHRNVGVCWNSNPSDLDGQGFDYNFDLVKHKIFQVHMRDLYLEDYPWRRLLTRLNEIGYRGYCFAEIPESADPVRVLRYYRALWLAYQGLL